MFFFRKRQKPLLPEPDLTRVRLYNGAYYPYDDAAPPNHVYTLCEWTEDSDSDFPELAIDCALAILADYPIVINCLWSSFVGETVREDEEITQYLKSISWLDFGRNSSVVTMTNGPDRNLISTQSITDESVFFTFYAYRQLPSDGVVPGTPFIPDVEIRFAHLHTRLVITTMNGIDMYADKIRAVCKKYGKTLVVQELPSHKKDSI